MTGVTWPPRQNFEPKHGTAERWDVCDCIDCRRATGRPLAPAMRRELAMLLKRAADKFDEWKAAAWREWEPWTEAHHGREQNRIPPEMEGPYIEQALARSWKDTLRRMADNLSADETTPPPVDEPPCSLCKRTAAGTRDGQRCRGRCVVGAA